MVCGYLGVPVSVLWQDQGSGTKIQSSTLALTVERWPTSLGHVLGRIKMIVVNVDM